MSLADIYDAPLEYVVEQEGVMLSRRGDRLVGLCPFHHDTDPSLTVWSYGDREWVGCFSCNFGPTDGLGFIRELHHCTHQEALVRAARHAKSLPNDWAPTDIPMRSGDGYRDFRIEAERAHNILTHDFYRPGTALNRFLMSRGLQRHYDWLVKEFRLGGDAHWIAVPHWTPSGDAVPGLKYRRWDGELKTMDDSVLAFLYGGWRDVGQSYVLVVEGESDTWRVSAFFREDQRVLVVGLPSGAKGPRPAWLESIGGRSLGLLFDGDRAGRDARDLWLEARPDARAFDPGDGRDASDLEDEELRGIMEHDIVRTGAS